MKHLQIKTLFYSLLFGYLLSRTFSLFGLATDYPEPLNNEDNYFLFEKITSGNIAFDLYVPDSKETRLINILTINEGTKEIVFSIPVIAGTGLYPQKIIPDTLHHFEIEFDLSLNFCKIFINGSWLTSVLAKQQNHFINAVTIDFKNNENKCPAPINLTAGGRLFEFESPLKIVAFGNSTTAFRSTITGVYSQRIPEYFKDKDLPVQIFNEGVGGSHTGRLEDNSLHKVKHALDRFEDAILSKDPDIVIISFGINDSWADSENPEATSRISLNDYRNNLHFMISKLKNKNVKVILMTPNGLGKNREPWRHERLEKYAIAVREIAKKENQPLIDQWKIFNEYVMFENNEKDDFLLDGVHPNDRWHEILAKTISELILDILISDPPQKN